MTTPEQTVRIANTFVVAYVANGIRAELQAQGVPAACLTPKNLLEPALEFCYEYVNAAQNGPARERLS